MAFQHRGSKLARLLLVAVLLGTFAAPAATADKIVGQILDCESRCWVCIDDNGSMTRHDTKDAAMYACQGGGVVYHEDTGPVDVGVMTPQHTTVGCVPYYAALSPPIPQDPPGDQWLPEDLELHPRPVVVEAEACLLSGNGTSLMLDV